LDFKPIFEKKRFGTYMSFILNHYSAIKIPDHKSSDWSYCGDTTIGMFSSGVKKSIRDDQSYSEEV